MDSNLRMLLDSFVAENRDKMLEDLKALVKIDSTKGEPTEGAPLGEGVKKCLAEVDALFEKNGFSAENHDILC